MEPFIEADGNRRVAVRDPRRDLQTGSPIAEADEGVSPGGLKAFGERPRHASAGSVERFVETAATSC